MPDLGQLIGGGVLLALVGILCVQIYKFRADLTGLRVRVTDVEAEVAEIKSRCRDHHGQIGADFTHVHDAIRLMAKEHEAGRTALLTLVNQMQLQLTSQMGEIKAQVAGALAAFTEHVRQGANSHGSPQG